MSKKQKNKNSASRIGLCFKIIFLAGMLVAIGSLFIPADKGSIIEEMDIPNLFQAFTSHVQEDENSYVQLLFGHSKNPITLSTVLLDILILYLPFAFLATTACTMFLAPEKKVCSVFGLTGSAMMIGIDMFLLITGTTCLGVYISMVGVLLMILGILLFYLGREVEDEEDEYNEDQYEVAGVITCMSGELEGNRFEIPDIVVIGKNPNECNIVLSNRTVSRVHCIIKYVPQTDTYTVKDVSSNGTFFSDGRPLTRNYEMQVKRGTEIYMGEPREAFYLD